MASAILGIEVSKRQKFRALMPPLSIKRLGLITDISQSKAKATLCNLSSSFLPHSAIEAEI